MVYFNWLGSWHLLGDDDAIGGGNPRYFSEEKLQTIKENFVDIIYKDETYHVHISQIMWKK